MFESCVHGNIKLTCPSCKARTGPAPYSPPSVAAEPASIDLGDVMDRVVSRVERTGQREAFADKSQWERVNPATTPHDHDSEHGRL